MRTPISISHQSHAYRVVFRSFDKRAILDPEVITRSRRHVLALGKRDYDACGETPEDAVFTARNFLALDRQIDGTPDAAWSVDFVARY